MKQLLLKSAREHHLSARTAWWIFCLPIIGAVLLPICRLDKEVYRFLIDEDGPIEWLQVTFFLMAGIFAIGTAINLYRKSGSQSLFFVLLALGLFFISGEEISWGQRVFGVETPESLRAINKQDETNLHNIVGVLDIFNLVMMLGAGWAATAWYWNRRLRLERYWPGANHLLVPPFFLTSSFALLFAYKLFRFTVWPQGGFTVTKFGEWPEFCLALSLFFYAWLNYRRTVSENVSNPVTCAVPHSG